MKFKFLGDTKNMQVYGYDFSDGATPDVTDDFVIAKLQGNKEFEAVGAAVKPQKEKKEKKDDQQATSVQDVDGQGEAISGETDGNLPGIE